MEYGLIGAKLGHSWSVPIHAQLGDYDYRLYERTERGFIDLMKKRDFKGVNVTIPYKRLAYDLCDALSDTARDVGSVNTVIVRPDGSLYGHNTDIGGFMALARHAGVDIAGKKCAILGSGGTSLTAQAACRRLGARQIVVVSRKGPVDYEALYRDHADAQVLVNTTPVGMYPNNGASAADLSRLPRLEGVLDVVYNPDRTALVLDAEARGLPAAGGLYMLVGQAREAAELFMGRDIPESETERIYRQLRGEMLNLVLIGMPGSGKSSIGRALAERTGRPFADCDAEIVRRAGKTIPDIFAAGGDQFAVHAVFDNLAFPQYHDSIQAGHSGEAVRDHDRGAPFHEVLKRSLNQLLALRVERAGGFVQNKDRRICQNSARDSNSLPLPA